ncbi:MAG: carboxypeptidase-like regulatory domain-containing protein [Thermoguttaceae bacterium]|jgi:hypothetical protein
MRGTPWILASLVLGAALSTIGCGQAKDPNRPDTYPVTGTVTHGGKPVEGAIVKFELADGSRSATGKTDASGKYALTTFGANDGALPGSYKVSILKYEAPPAPAATGDSMANYVPPEVTKNGQQPPPPKNLLPTKYADAKTSGLTATVKSDGENKCDFTLQ